MPDIKNDDEQKQVLLLGDINLDISMQMESLPRAGEDRQADSLNIAPGGAVVNSAVVLSRLGQSCALICHTGEDLLAERVLSQLRAQTNIDLQYVQRSGAAHSGVIYVAVTADSERSMFSYRGANLLLAPEHLPLTALQNAALLHLSGYSVLKAPHSLALWRAVEFANEHGVPISLDTGLDPALAAPDAMRRLISHCTVCVLGMQEAHAMYAVESAEEALRAIFAQSTRMRLAAVKLGAAGCMVSEGRNMFRANPFSVRVIDATGAGDGFSAGLIYAWLRGWPAQDCAMLANTMGALATQVRGGGTALPGRVEALEFLAQQQGAVCERMYRLLEENHA